MWFILLFLCPKVFASLQLETPRQSQGERLLNELRESILSYGPCWQRAVENLQYSCSSLDENSQHRMALEFTSCFVQKLGHAGYRCEDSESIEECEDFRTLPSSSHLGTYSNFFTHSQVICSFLQQQQWQSNTLRVINALSDSSSDLSSKLNDLNDVMDSTREDQDRLQELTRVALSANQELSTKIASQGSSLSIMLDQIQYVNTVIAGHASTLSSFAYFMGGILVSFLLTTPEQTRQVRSWLLLLFTTNLLIELAILQWALEFAGLSHEYFKSENPINFKLQLSRRVFCCLSFVIYIYKAITYRSPEERSHSLLLEMYSAVNQLDSRMQRIESALTIAAARVRKTYDFPDHRESPVRFRESTPLAAPPKRRFEKRFQEEAEEPPRTTETVSQPAAKQPSGPADQSGAACRRSSRVKSPAVAR